MTGSDNSALVIVGAGGHANVALDIARSLGHPVRAFLDKLATQGQLDGIPVLSELSELADTPDNFQYVVAIGDNFVRGRVVTSLLGAMPQIRFATLVHPTAIIARSSQLGKGTVVMAGAVVNPGSRIGEHCIVNTRATVDHDNKIENFSSLAPGAVTGGNVQIGEYASVSLGASVIHGITIGAHSIVGAGAAVVENVPDFSVVIGVPARVLKQRKAGDPYL